MGSEERMDEEKTVSEMPEQAPDTQKPAESESPDKKALEEMDIEQLRAELEASRARADENLRHWQRTQADFMNYRRRAEQERADIVKYAESQLILELLSALDDFDRAMETMPRELMKFTWVQGIVLIDRKIRSILERHGLTPIEALGKEFDPYYHEAVMREDGDAGEHTMVVAELQKGYKLHDRVLRPTLVKVGRAKKEEEPEAKAE